MKLQAPPLHQPRAVVEQLIGSAIGTLRLAHGLVEANRPVDLSGLDQDIGVLCAQTLDLPPAQGRALRAELGTLRDVVDGLADALQRAAPPS